MNDVRNLRTKIPTITGCSELNDHFPIIKNIIKGYLHCLDELLRLERLERLANLSTYLN